MTELRASIPLALQAVSLHTVKQASDNVLKSWVEESPHPYDNDSLISRVSRHQHSLSLMTSRDTPVCEE